jgi:hypothetical protein
MAKIISSRSRTSSLYKQCRWDAQVDGLTRQTGWSIDVPTLTAKILLWPQTVLTRQNKADWPSPKAVHPNVSSSALFTYG